MNNPIEKSVDLTVQDAINTWNRANPEKLIKKFLPDLADQVYIRAYPNSDHREYDIVRFDEEDFLLYDFFLKYKFDGDKSKCDAFVVKLISDHEEKKAKVSEDLMTEQKKAEAEEIKAIQENVNAELLSKLRMNKNRIAEDPLNYELILQFEGLNLRKNDLTKQIEFDIPAWMHRTVRSTIFTDDDASRVSSYINENYQLKSKQYLEQAIENVANKNSYHPLRDYFNNLPKWDGIPRIDGLMKAGLNVIDEYYEETDGTVHNFADTVLKMLMTAAYRRAMSDTPVKYDQGVLLIGEQGRCKSTFVKRLAAGFDTDAVTFSDIVDRKAAIEKIEGKLFAEVPEFYFSNKRREVDAIKSFMSTDKDRFRRAYGKRVEDINRLTVFVMTSNDQSHSILTDATGSRRWLILDCGKEDPVFDVYNDMTPDFVAQLWAELIDRDQHGGKSIADTTSIAVIPHSGLWDFANRKATLNLKTDSKEDTILQALKLPIPKNWNQWSDHARTDYLNDPSLTKIQAQETEPRKYVDKNEIWCNIMGKKWSDIDKGNEFMIENICNKLGLILCISEVDGKRRFQRGRQPRTYWRIPTEEEWEKSHPDVTYPYVYDPSDLNEHTESEAFWAVSNKAEKANSEKDLSQRRLSNIVKMTSSAMEAAKKGDMDEVMRLLNNIKAECGTDLTTTEEPLENANLFGDDIL